MQGSIIGQSDWSTEKGSFAAGAALAGRQGVQSVVQSLISSRVVPAKGAVGDTNVSHAVGKAAVSIATGLVLGGSVSDPTAGVVACLACFTVGQALMVAAVLFYCRLTPYDDLAESKRDNLAASFPIVGMLWALGLVIEAAVATKGDGTIIQTVLHVGKFLGASLVLVYVFRLVASYVLLPNTKLSTVIVEQRSVAAGLQEGVSFLLVSLIVTYFLS